MDTKITDFYNFIVAGGGPAGLTAGITAARNGLKVVVLEKGKVAGPRPRGEGVRRQPILEDMLGKNFFETRCFKMGGGSVYHSPGDLQQTRLTSRTPLFFFEWRDFIDKLVETAEDLGVKIVYQAEVLEPVENEEGICIGVRYKDESKKIQEVSGNALLGCDGHKSTVGRHYSVPYDRMNCSMVKCLADNADIDIEKTPDLQFYLIGNGDLEYAPRFPQCVAYGFPIGDKKMELGLMLRMSHAHKMGKTVEIPDEKTVMMVWNRLKRDYPGFSAYFNQAKIEHEEITGLSNASMVKQFVPGKGVVLIGDSAGFIDPFGSSGVISGMAMAECWVTMLSGKLIELAGGEKEISGHIHDLWSRKSISDYHQQFEKTQIFKQINGSYSLIGKFEWYIFKHLRTSERINKRWKLISWLLKRV
ncbi:MAG: NAD(P)/FAD-dependent oxidoreductase [Proteobacteria bacterium]|nr:NAD(P)/FAD-dependent oxidoreductase [Pseudomonadota bacterium]